MALFLAGHCESNSTAWPRSVGLDHAEAAQQLFGLGIWTIREGDFAALPQHGDGLAGILEHFAASDGPVLTKRVAGGAALVEVGVSFAFVHGPKLFLVKASKVDV